MLSVGDLFKRYAAEIHRALRRRGHDTDIAADLTQDTFLRILTARSRTLPDNPGAYLHQIARNLSVDLHRRNRRVEIVDLTDDQFQLLKDPTVDQETTVIHKQRLEIVERALLELPDKTRTAFELYQQEDRTISEVADIIGLSVSRTWTLIRRAYLHLKLRLDELG